MATSIYTFVTNLLSILLAPLILPILLLYMKRINDWPRARRSCSSKTLLHGKTAIVTGANAGIGKETAKELARRGARVIMACRNLEKARLVGTQIADETGSRDVIVKELDLSNLESVRKFVQEILETEQHLEILINNAGLIFAEGKTKQGYNLTVGTNYVGHFLLTHLLTDLMKKSAPARIVNVSSCDHARVRKLDLSCCTPTPNDSQWPFAHYSISKLLLVLHAKKLGRRLKGSGVTTYSLHPGFVHTNISTPIHSKVSTVMSYLYNIAERTTGLDTKSGAQTTLFCALEESIQQETGKYYDNCRQREPGSAFARDDHMSAEVYDTTLNSLRQIGFLP